ncbi:MAG TPA: Hsp20/alpha crystallin family protein [Spirochaetia bacterium]|nr:Hsp20/alpha crystallin family protein [Spirochaetales bacterium]HRY72074.1 Hsp20/alpha crystallin family protein [Spirochaetia bacterium]
MDLAKWGAPATRDLWEAFDGLRGDMDRALDFFSLPDAAGLLDRTTAPAVDIVETEEEYLVVADLPGVDKRDLEVSVTGSLLAIKGVKKAEGNSGKRKVFRKETWVGSFSRTIDLPAEIDPGKIKAELKDGVLALRIAKREEAKTKLIAVNVQ